MKSAIPCLSLFSMLTVLVSSALAQTITLPEFLDLVKAKHPLFEREALAVDMAGVDRDANLGARDWRLSSSPSYFHQTPLPTSPFTPKAVDQFAAGAALEKVFWNTGGRFAVSWTSDFTDQDIEDIVIPNLGTISTGEPKFYQNQVLVSYTQPLFQNFKGELDRLGYDLSQYSVDMTSVQAAENQEQFLLDMGTRFIDWVLLTERKTFAAEQLGLWEQQLDQTRRKREANLVDEVDVLRAVDAVRIAEQNVVLVEAQWQAKQAELAVLSRSQELYSLNPDFNLYEVVDSESLDSASDRLKAQSRLLKVLALRREQMERQYQGFKELTKPQLYLQAQLASKSGDSELGGALGLNKSDAGVFLQFSYPLGNRKARADVTKNQLQIRHHDLETEDVVMNLEAGLHNLLIQMQGLERVMALNAQQIISARLKTQEELKRYNQGRGDLTFVIQSQDNEERARLTYAVNAATYQSLNLRLKALLDELLIKDS